MRTLSLLAPGLFDSLPSLATAMPQPPALLTLLARARQRRAVAGDSDELLLQLFGIAAVPDADAPVAALSCLGETESMAADGYWLRADPVHLRADQSRLFLFGPDVLSIRMDEARALAAAFNAVYSDVGWQLMTPHPQRWYLRLPEDPGIHTRPLHTVIGRNIEAFLPQGTNGKRWHAVLNEVQMLFHGNPVNTAREERDQLPINSVWFWGGGQLPVIKPQLWTQLCSVDPCARGLATAAGVARMEKTEIVAAWSGKGRDAKQLVVMTDLRDAVLYDDVEGWHTALMELERDWFVPALAALKSGGLDALHLYPGNDSVYAVTRAGVRRFWHRRRAFDTYR